MSVPFLEQTKKKLREADFFFGHLIEQSQRQKSVLEMEKKTDEAFDFYLSAFLTAVRSVTDVLRKEAGITADKYDAWYSEWLRAQSDDDRNLLLLPDDGKSGRGRKKDLIREQRDAEVHREGARVRGEYKMVPLAEQGEGGNYWFGPPRIDPPLVRRLVHYFDGGVAEKEVLAACKQHLQLTNALVAHFIEEHSIRPCTHKSVSTSAVKRRDPEAPIRVALDDVRCPRCNGHGRTRIVGLSRYPSI
jgi:hypothetical protein